VLRDTFLAAAAQLMRVSSGGLPDIRGALPRRRRGSRAPKQLEDEGGCPPQVMMETEDLIMRKREETIQLETEEKLLVSAGTRLKQTIIDSLSGYIELSISWNPGDSVSSNRDVSSSDINRFLPQLDPTKLADERSADIAQQFAHGILAVLSSFPLNFAAVTPMIVRTVQEMNCGSGKSLPITLLDLLQKPELISEPEMRDAFTKQNAELYSFIGKKYRRALQTGSRPHHVEGSGSDAVQAVENDFCGALTHRSMCRLCIDSELIQDRTYMYCDTHEITDLLLNQPIRQDD
jgi:hypothetical protein